MDFWHAIPAPIREQGLFALTLVFILWAGAKRYWVFGWVYEEKAKHAERIEALLDRNVAITERATHVAESVVRR